MKKVIYFLIFPFFLIIIAYSFVSYKMCNFYKGKTRWSCTPKEGFVKSPRTRKNIWPPLFSLICKIQKGEVISSCLGHCSYSCNFPYPDAGKPCKNSSECLGTCTLSFDDRNKYCVKAADKDLYNVFKCDKETLGYCYKYSLTGCEHIPEFKDGLLFYSKILCD